MSGKTTPQELELIPTRWTVVTKIVDRTPKHAVSITMKVRVSKLIFDGRLADPVMILEGTQSDRTLQEFADKLNAEGRILTRSKKAFADLPEATRRKTMVRKAQSFTGPGFGDEQKQPPKKKQPVR